MPLTDTAIRSTKPIGRTQRLYDADGLYLEISPKGGKWWRFKYRFEGREKRISLGVYPEVGLSVARHRRNDARQQLAVGIDPSAARKASKSAGVDLFESVAREWFAKHAPGWAPSHANKIIRRLERDVFPSIGTLPVGEIDSQELLRVLQRIESRGAIETAHRAKQTCGRVFRYAVATGRASRDPAGDLKDALPPPIKGRYPTITDPKEVGALLRAIDGFTGSFIVRSALQLAPLVFVRPGELRHAEWSEIDLGAAEWRISGTKMKSKELHIVPLSVQAVGILRELYPLTGAGRYAFPGARSLDRAMSEATINAALRRLGYTKTEMTGHGFRSMASTLLNEQGWHRDAIERQLAHAERDSVRAAYNRAEHLPERRKMMQAWADYLDGLRAGANVVAIGTRGVF
jgi:integrase